MVSVRAVAWQLAVLSLLCSFVVAQSSTTSLRGTVTDASGASVAHADVTLSNPERAVERTAKTGSEGEYEFLQVPPGTYRRKRQDDRASAPSTRLDYSCW